MVRKKIQTNSGRCISWTREWRCIDRRKLAEPSIPLPVLPGGGWSETSCLEVLHHDFSALVNCYLRLWTQIDPLSHKLFWSLFNYTREPDNVDNPHSIWVIRKMRRGELTECGWGGRDAALNGVIISDISQTIVPTKRKLSFLLPFWVDCVVFSFIFMYDIFSDLDHGETDKTNGTLVKLIWAKTWKQ